MEGACRGLGHESKMEGKFVILLDYSFRHLR